MRTLFSVASYFVLKKFLPFAEGRHKKDGVGRAKESFKN
jgi:hypothetical protein